MGKMNELSMLNARVEELFTGYFLCEPDEQGRRTDEYREVLQPSLLAIYGVDADAPVVDPWMFDVYSDLYKDRYNIRPRGHSYRTMMTFMDNIPPLEDFEEEELEDEGDRFDPDISKWAGEDDEEIKPMDLVIKPDADFEARLKDFEDVYGVPAFSQAINFSVAEMENY